MPFITPSHHDRVSNRPGAAFTLTELLVVLAVITLLVCLRLPALARVKTQTWITQCSGNLRQVGMSFLLYGSENGGRLPTSNLGYWLWDLPDPFYEAFSIYSGSLATNIYYCPSNPYQNSLWNYDSSPNNPSNIYHPTGYVLHVSGRRNAGEFSHRALRH